MSLLDTPDNKWKYKLHLNTNLPVKAGPNSQLFDANPPKTCPSLSLTTITAGPCLAMCRTIVAKLAPSVCEEKRCRHSPRHTCGRWGLSRRTEGRSKRVVALFQSILRHWGRMLVSCRELMLTSSCAAASASAFAPCEWEMIKIYFNVMITLIIWSWHYRFRSCCLFSGAWI